MTMDVYGHLLAPTKMQAADAMRRALWLDELPDFDPLATSLAVGDGTTTRNSAVTSDSVGRPGLDPGTLGLKVLIKPLLGGAPYPRLLQKTLIEDTFEGRVKDGLT
ncbi:MAG: hypothetical protein ABSB68_09040 [Acidimicrobiales bacterium]